MKKLIFSIYNLFLPRIKHDLKVEEHERLLHHIIGKIETIKQNQVKLEHHLKTISTFVSGVDMLHNPIYNETNIAAQEINEVYETLKYKKLTSVSIINYFFCIKEVDFKHKTVCVVGGNDNLFSRELKKRGAKKVIRIETTPLLHEKTKNINKDADIFYAFPTHLNKLRFPPYDLILVPDKYLSSLLLKNNLYDLGIAAKEGTILSLEITNSTVLTNTTEPKFRLSTNGEEVVFNDNYARVQLHQNGFYEVQCLYTYGAGIDNYFDQKVSRHNYKNNLTVLNQNNKLKKNTLYNNENSSIKIYYARKLPSVKNIKKH